jgi:nucleotide-binding universal stress UspA family protein
MAVRILVPLDGSSLAATALAHAISLVPPQELHITLLRVVERTIVQQSVDPLDWHLQQAEAQAYLEQTAKALGELAAITPEVALLEGRAPDRIVDYAHGEGFDLIAFTSHGRGGLTGWNMSSIASKIAVQAAISILLVRPSNSSVSQYESSLQPVQYNRIVVPLDGSLRAEHVLPIAGSLAERHAAELILVHVVPRPELIQRMPLTEEEIELVDKVVARNQRQAVDYFEELGSRLPARPQTHVLVNGDVTGELHRFVAEQQADLVVLSAHGYTGRQDWAHGSLVTSFLAHGNTPLLILQDMPKQVNQPGLEAAAHTWKEAGLRAALSTSNLGAAQIDYDRTTN